MKNIRNDREYIALAIAALALFVAALGHWPYFLYVLLRIFICFVSIVWCHRNYREKRKAWPWIFAGTAILYNPLLPIRMARSDWEWANVLTGLAFCSLIGISSLELRRTHSSLREREAQQWLQRGRDFYDLADIRFINIPKAIEYFKRGLEMMPSSSDLHVYLGIIYWEELSPPDYAMAFEHFSAAAELGDPSGQRSLAEMYEEGRAVPKDETRAIFWYQKAAEQGDDSARDRLFSLIPQKHE